MIVWLNGTFGAGKTTTARELTQLISRSRMFDSEQIGSMLRHVLTEPVEDFQDWPPWRPLVTQTAVEVLRYVGGTLVIPQTVLVERYAREIFRGFDEAGIPVQHFLLHVRPDELVARIEADQVETLAREWRLNHIAAYQAALPWLRDAADVIDTSNLAPENVAQEISNRVVLENS
ncbi:AAA family ATPase [Actinokineospora xionganensis]|uniref:AAA family ATPase n=1 Tax=Actinokineospora xionganensis TaxID=2684470 RepID=A0ABR7L4I8_9PSEU|nr:AAA family ATPase [Actinokineospora xionganensis]MBC6447600.1 AAA family ATPase [Actinokineospora xionganensis]